MNGSTSMPRIENNFVVVILSPGSESQYNHDLRFTLHVSAAARNSTINIMADIMTAANVAFGINRKDCVR